MCSSSAPPSCLHAGCAQGFDLAHVHVDPHSELLSVVAENLEGTERANRTVKLPCAVERPLLITATLHSGRVVVTIPSDALAPQEEPALAMDAEPTGEMKELKVHVYPPRAGKMEAEHKEGVLTITVHGMHWEGINVELEGKVISITGKSTDCSADIHRHFKLQRRLLKPEAVKAAYDKAQHAIVVTVPDEALEKKTPKAARTKVPVG